MAANGREIEYKLRAAAPLEIARVDAVLRETGLPVRSRGSVVHVDVYLDTPDHALRRRGFGLRMRRADDAPCAMLTCKDRGRRDGARFERREIEAPWLAAFAPATVAALPAEMRRVLPTGQVGPLVETLRLLVRRERRVLVDRDGPLAEVVVDRVTAERNGATATFEEVEVEAHRDETAVRAVVERLRMDLGLLPAGEDKPSWAVELLGARLPESPPSPAEHGGESPAIRAAIRFAAEHLPSLPPALGEAGAAWLRNRIGEDPTPTEAAGELAGPAARTAVRTLRAACWRVVREPTADTVRKAAIAAAALAEGARRAPEVAAALGSKRCRAVERLAKRLDGERLGQDARVGFAELLAAEPKSPKLVAAALGAWWMLADQVELGSKKTLRRCRRLARQSAWPAMMPS